MSEQSVTMALFRELAVIIGLAGGVWGLFALLEVCATNKLKRQVRGWLMDGTPRARGQPWASTFVGAFDGLFGRRLVSWRFALVSSGLSVVFVVLLIGFWTTHHPEEATSYFKAGGFGPVLLIGVIVTTTNLVPDYLSNCQSRYIIGKLVTSGQYSARLGLTKFGWLIVDLVLTVALAAAVVIPVSVAATKLLASFDLFADMEIPQLLDLERFLSLQGNIIMVNLPDDGRGWYEEYTPPFGAFFFSTLLTSLWLWLYAAGGTAIRFFRRTFGAEAVMFDYLDFEGHPLTTLGGVCACAITFLYGLTWVALWLESVSGILCL